MYESHFLGNKKLPLVAKALVLLPFNRASWQEVSGESDMSSVKCLPLWEELSFPTKFFKRIRDNHKLSFPFQTYIADAGFYSTLDCKSSECF